ncbi:protein translocase subunit SecF [Shouchella clausii]|uniref:Protein-export membrane protein SecF n=2 Tax=Shouchella TaxID=2893057 RepID=A0A268P5D4_SHOCL|nr:MULTISPECIES: protein translocase subunit SecF [Shouchella]MCM3313814.1 protein translocase subunit SecF [Psychrobacillus sp. MER TA 17]ALA51281.1 Protein-export membrane protein SecF [Shouchella clausii]MBU3232696.1 protein translocase subunit SecF [Shouchella clausii]MBU3265593.1 protein translocase subunit SecF [Shouchella clausii]MBU3508578.1 protein translocase subunit SecF [Shouchella clausii]
MSFNPEKWNVDLTKHRKRFFIGSGLSIVLGIVLLLTFGLNLGVDFESGSNVEIQADQTLTQEQLLDDFAAINESYTPNITLGGEQSQSATARFTVELSKDEITAIQTYFQDKYGHSPNVSTVSPLVGQELARNAILSVLIASLGIVIYIGFRFHFLYGVSAVIGLLHDAFIIIALFSLFQVEINVPFIAAVLTVVGYSINDTIVTFDRMRENINKEKEIKSFEHLAQIVNKSLLQVLTRSINTVLTVLFAAVALLIFGGEAIRSFSLALVIGLIAGTYSSMFLCAQIWLVWEWKRQKKLKNKPKKTEEEYI